MLKPGKLQADNNKLQQEMIEVKKTNDEVTARHNTTMRRLKWALVVMTLITLVTNIVWLYYTVKMVR